MAEYRIPDAKGEVAVLRTQESIEEAFPEIGLLAERWAVYAEDVDPEAARADFECRYGRPPASLVRAGSVLLAGPVRETADTSPLEARRW